MKEMFIAARNQKVSEYDCGNKIIFYPYDPYDNENFIKDLSIS